MTAHERPGGDDLTQHDAQRLVHLAASDADNAYMTHILRHVPMPVRVPVIGAALGVVLTAVLAATLGTKYSARVLRAAWHHPRALVFAVLYSMLWLNFEQGATLRVLVELGVPKEQAEEEIQWWRANRARAHRYMRSALGLPADEHDRAQRAPNHTAAYRALRR